jgi:hypothetical protein
MRKKLLALLAVAVLGTPGIALAQIGQTATLQGIVTDSSGGVLPGVTVTASSESVLGGSRTAVTDESGVYRFPALPPGTYTVKIELSGFRTTTQEARLQLGQTSTVDAVMQPGLTDTIEVVAAAPTVDVKSSASQKNLSQEVLEFIPYGSRFGPDAISLAPGVNPNNNTAFGGAGNANAWMIDGVDVSDPRSGAQWLFANYNWFQEVQLAGLGAPAEYGGFTGLASNSLIRSGGNRFSGLIETLYQNSDMIGDNVSEDVLAQNPDLTAEKLDYVTDSTFQVGGPLQRDRAWFFTSFQYYRPNTAPSGYPPPDSPTPGIGPTSRQETSPRFIVKPSLRIGQADQLTGFLEYDRYDIEGRGAASNVEPAATLQERAPEFAWNMNYTKVVSPSSVFDIRYAGFDGYFALEPYNGRDIMGWYDATTDFYSVNSYYFLRSDRERHQVNSSLTKFASGFAGEHNLKFGAELERSYTKTDVGYPGGGYILADAGEPYFTYLGGAYVLEGTNTRLSVFAQDSWSVNRKLTINPGLRLDYYRGSLREFDDPVMKTTSWGPRVGFAYDLAGNGRTVIRGHYGRFFDGAKTTYFTLLQDKESLFGAAIDPISLLPIEEPYLITPGESQTTIDSDIKHPRMDQAIVGFEHELFSNFAVGANFIYRKSTNFVEDILTNGEFEVTSRPDPGDDGTVGTSDDPGTFLNVYNQLNDQSENEFFITNPDDAFRRYRGLEMSASKRFTNGWMVEASWVISENIGNINNTTSAGNSTEYDDPNLTPGTQPFREGNIGRDNTHIGKVLWAYQAPWKVMVSGAYFFTSGGTYTRTVRYRLNQGSLDLFAEPRGSRRLDDQSKFDIKFEKRFKIANGNLGVTVESFNLFNSGAIDDVFPRSGADFGIPQSIVAPRTWRIGGVFRF